MCSEATSVSGSKELTTSVFKELTLCFKRQRRQAGCGFLDTEAELSGEESCVSSDESEGGDGELEMSFVDDCTQLSQDVSHGKYIVVW